VISCLGGGYAGNVDADGVGVDGARAHGFCVSSSSPSSLPFEFCVACDHAGCEEDYGGVGYGSEYGLHHGWEG